MLHFIDGQRGDGDLTQDGQISALGAPAFEGSQSSVTFNSGLMMVSLPYNYSGSGMDAATLFDLAPIGSAIPIATADPTTATYLFYPNLPGANGKQPLPGRGYWINETTMQPFLSTSAGKTVPSPFDSPVSGGWNMVGNPFTGPLDMNTLQFSVPTQVGVIPPNTFMSLQDAMSNRVVRSSFYTYDPTSNRYVLSTMLMPFAGYWLYIDPQTVGSGTVTMRFVNPNG